MRVAFFHSLTRALFSLSGGGIQAKLSLRGVSLAVSLSLSLKACERRTQCAFFFFLFFFFLKGRPKPTNLTS